MYTLSSTLQILVNFIEISKFETERNNQLFLTLKTCPSFLVYVSGSGSAEDRLDSLVKSKDTGFEHCTPTPSEVKATDNNVSFSHYAGQNQL